MTDCTRKTIFGRPACWFEARYDLSPINLSVFRTLRIGPESLEMFIDGNRSKTYVRDV